MNLGSNIVAILTGRH